MPHRVHLRAALCSFCAVAVASNGCALAAVCRLLDRACIAANWRLEELQTSTGRGLQQSWNADSAAAERLYRSGIRDAAIDAAMQLRRARRLGHNFGRGAATGEKIEVARPTCAFLLQHSSLPLATYNSPPSERAGFAARLPFQSSSLVDPALHSASVLAAAPDCRSSIAPLSRRVLTHTVPILCHSSASSYRPSTLCQRVRPLLHYLCPSFLRRLAVIAFVHSNHPPPTVSCAPSNRHG